MTERTERPSVLAVVQRYGDVSGGAEAHARELVAHLRPVADLAVATTTAADYWTWAERYTPGLSWVDGIPVHRFPVASGRTRDFRSHERQAFAAQNLRLYQTLAVQSDRMWVLWFYCSTTDSSLQGIYYEATDGTAVTFESAFGTCQDASATST